METPGIDPAPLSHAKRALYHVSYTPSYNHREDLLNCQNMDKRYGEREKWRKKERKKEDRKRNMEKSEKEKRRRKKLRKDKWINKGGR